MTQEKKFQIRNALQRYMQCYPNRLEMLSTLKGIHPELVKNVLNFNWHLLQPQQWQALARKVGFYSDDWMPADTGTFLLLNLLFNDAARHTQTYGIALSKATGKSFTAEYYAKQHPDTLYLKANNIHTQKTLLSTLLKQLFMHPSSTVNTMIKQLHYAFDQMNEPLLIIDDAHKLKPSVLQMLGLLINGKCGVIIMGNEKLAQRIQASPKRFAKLFLQLGNRFIKGNPNRMSDAALLCKANGIDDPDKITELCRYGADLHQLTMAIKQRKMMAVKKYYAFAA
jgi:hypothetical protein